MPYVVGVETLVDEGPVTSVSIAVPGGHQSGDYAVVIAGQDVGTTAIAAPGGWTEETTQTNNNAQRLAVFWKKLTSSSEPDVALTGLSESWTVACVLLRGVHPTTPINVSARSGSATNNSSVSNALTTTAVNCLVLRAVHGDAGGRFAPEDLGCSNAITRILTSGNCLAVSSNNAPVAGAVPQITLRTSASGRSMVDIAFNDDGVTGLGPQVTTGPGSINRLGGFTSLNGTTLTWAAPSATGIASILGAPLSTAASTTQVATVEVASMPYMRPLNIVTTDATDGTTGLWSGVSAPLPAPVNLSGKLVSMTSQTSNPAGFGSKGSAIVFLDAAGNWAAYRLDFPTLSKSAVIQTAISVGGSAAIDSGGSIDWTAVTRIAILVHRTLTTTSSRNLTVRDLLVLDPVTLVGGSAAAPVNLAAIRNATDGWLDSYLSRQQGAQQSYALPPLRFGDGSTRTYVRLLGGSLELPAAYAPRVPNLYWTVDADRTEVRVRASATCVMDFGAAVLSSGSRQLFVIDAASSPSATYSFDGATFVGWRVENNTAGVPLAGALFNQCHRITLNGGLLQQCSLIGAVESPAVRTNDPDNISDCRFEAGPAGGHAIEITAPGTYLFSGNTFSGYGANGTTDAAIYNNSGGAVTLNITGGGSTPTVRNGAGASTTVNSGATVTFTGLPVGTDVVVLAAGTGTILAQQDSNPTTSYAFSYTGTPTVDVGFIKPGFVPRYLRDLPLGASDASTPVSFSADRNYS